MQLVLAFDFLFLGVPGQWQRPHPPLTHPISDFKPLCVVFGEGEHSAVL